ncbi:unnamed protein product [Rotaria magnacalcarata]|uniref:G-protein coupled receptors family 1 profile domain-containing protein n=1 Tax=Rotaria magnacalcarata TaxID=392030 RepID=A0A817AQV8_9BILA|nr:unnamed protein product [Rotaria magnacalcarata]
MTSDNDIYRWYADVIVYRGFGPLIACLGAVGGILSLFVFRRKSLRKKSCSIYFFYLALADLLCMICWLVHFVLPTYNIHILTLSNFFCKIFVFAMYFAFDLANYILTVCSIDRAISVLCPIRSRKFCRERTAYTITFILVIIHTILNSHLLYGFVVLSARTISTPSIRICHHRVDSETYRNFFSIYDSYVDVIKTNAIPFIIMFVCNIIIIIRVCRSKSSMNFNGKNRCRKAKKRVEKDRQLTLMLLGSAIAFLVLTLPTETCASELCRPFLYIYINRSSLRRCKLSPLTLASETTMNQRTSVRNNQSTQMNMSPFPIKMNDDNDSLT